MKIIRAFAAAAAPQILGNNTAGGASGTASNAGRMYVSKFTLATGGTLTELHGNFFQTTGTPQVQIVLYSDSAGSPNSRLAFTSPITVTNGTPAIEYSQSGFSVSLSSGTYWVGWCAGGSGLSVPFDSNPEYKGSLASASFNPPNATFPTVDTSGTRSYRCWGVVT